MVKNIVNNSFNPGNHSVIWDGKDKQGIDCGTSVYFYKMTADSYSQTKKMMLIK